MTKSKSYVYMVTVKQGLEEVLVGIFSSEKMVEKCVKGLPKTKQYKAFKIPVNEKIAKGKTGFSDQRDKYLFRYLGTYEELYIKVDDHGSPESEEKRQVLFWPGKD